MIDHTNLKAFACTADIEKLCHEAAENKFASVCVNSVWVKKAAELLSGTGVEVCTVVGFPLGACNHATKAYEASSAVKDGATEVDMVIDIGAIKDGRWDDVKEDVAGVVSAVKQASENEKNKGIVKVILENCYLEKEEIAKASRICVEAGADFVKTSTGFGTSGATVDDVKLMRQTVGANVGVKAAGGIVEAPDGELLTIFREGRWDLPKGMVERGETLAEAALREVAEETGVCNASLNCLITKTYHIYDKYGGWHLKQTSWFAMNAPNKNSTVPQREEGITQAIWLPREECLDRLSNSFASLRLVAAKVKNATEGLTPHINVVQCGAIK